MSGNVNGAERSGFVQYQPVLRIAVILDRTKRQSPQKLNGTRIFLCPKCNVEIKASAVMKICVATRIKTFAWERTALRSRRTRGPFRTLRLCASAGAVVSRGESS